MISTGIIILACAALAADGLSVTNTSLPSAATATNILQTSEDKSDRNSGVRNAVCVKILYPDVPYEEFCVDDWAEELSNSAEEGLHIRNGHVLVVVRLKMYEDEYQALAKLRAKTRAVEFLRHHFPALPKKISVPCRVVVTEYSEQDNVCIVVMSFVLKDIECPA